MALTTGSRLGHYDVTALIREGGMGQVYQATDTQLNRQVALKSVLRRSIVSLRFTGNTNRRLGSPRPIVGEGSGMIGSIRRRGLPCQPAVRVRVVGLGQAWAQSEPMA